MQIIQSTKPAFRYLWKFGTMIPAYLAATRVAVFDLAEPEFFERCLGSIAIISNPDKAGGISLREMNARWMGSVNERLNAALLAEGLVSADKAVDFDPQLALAADSVSYHHDMPWSSCVFGAWCVDGPERVLHFPLMNIFIPFKPGTMVLFDPAQPHALLRPGQTHYSAADASDPKGAERISFVSFMASKAGPLAELLGAVAYDAAQHAHLPHTAAQYKVCKTHGTIIFESQETTQGALIENN